MDVGNKSQTQHIVGAQMLDTVITKHWVLHTLGAQ